MFLTALTVGPVQTNCYIVACEETKKAVVIDPGDEVSHILEVLGKNDLTLTAIINTHGHFDHAGGNKALQEATGVPIWIHEKDAFLLPILSDTGRLFGLDIVNSPPADMYLTKGQQIDIGTLSFTVLEVPGHTPGGIALYTPGIVFVGDSLFAGSIGRTDLPGGSTETLLHSIRDQLLTLPEETIVYPGHGPATTIGSEQKTNPFL